MMRKPLGASSRVWDHFDYDASQEKAFCRVSPTCKVGDAVQGRPRGKDSKHAAEFTKVVSIKKLRKVPNQQPRQLSSVLTQHGGDKRRRAAPASQPPTWTRRRDGFQPLSFANTPVMELLSRGKY